MDRVTHVLLVCCFLCVIGVCLAEPVEEACGDDICRAATGFAKAMKEKCETQSELDICKQSESWISKRFPGALLSDLQMQESLCFDQPKSPFSSPIKHDPSKFERLQDKLNNEHGGPPTPLSGDLSPTESPHNKASGDIRGDKPSGDTPKIGKNFKFGDHLLRRKRALLKKSSYQCGLKYRTKGESYVKRAYSSQCCSEERDTVQLKQPIYYGENNAFKAWPIWCPRIKRFQWIDQVRCVNTGCDGSCEVVPARRSYLVTNIQPDPFYGHCNHYWVPIWSMFVNVQSHCSCRIVLDASHFE